MNTELYRCRAATALLVICLVFVQASDGHPVVLPSKLALSFSANTLPSGAVDEAIYVHGLLPNDASPLSVVAHHDLDDRVYLSTALLVPRSNSGSSSSATRPFQILKRENSHMSHMTLSTILGIIAFLVLFIVLQIGLLSARKFDIFHRMKHSVYHPPVSTVPRPASHSCLSRLFTQSLNLGGTSRIPSPNLNVPNTLTVWTVSVNGVNPPPSALIADRSPGHCQ